ncbi:hypothetical protein [Hyalangium rubrum]|uniref:Uncharacterized protein n=1 Tax=Hyalangium rubrum TaxID=3103134 RepID=A0ABU5H2C4_9BACT|nr:hypothetical protein [Hyalangium sp. s54d21]MDY7227257.1 hypothetical protein [Hyalangium sp. s54d21]
MPRAFDITAATESVNLSASGQGELAFTVSNALRAPVRARATVMMAGQARPEWATIAGEAERDLAPDGTQQYIVKLQVPPGTPPGRYTFHVLVTNVANPDEQYADGPTVAFVVPEAAPVVKKAFPWWIVALAAGVLVIGGGVAAILAGRGGPDLGEPCEGTECGKGLACSGAAGGVCLGEDGFKGCKENGQCLSARCKEGRCAEAELGRNCGPGDTCPARQKCIPLLNTRTCLLAPGEACTGDGQCTSLYCKDERCTRDDGKCENNNECRPPSQCHTNQVCLLPDGQECSNNSVCISGFCSAGKCQQAPVPCVPACTGGLFCVSGRCMPIRVFPRVNEEIMRRGIRSPITQ